MMRQQGMELGSGRFHRVRFELTEALTPGGTAAAKVVVWDPSASSYVVTAHVIEVVDAVEVFSGEIGDRGQATWWGDSRGYEVDAMQAEAAETQAQWIRFTLPSALLTSEATKASATVDEYWMGSDPGETVTLANYEVGSGVYRWSGASGANGIAVLINASTNTYMIVDLECA